MTSFSVLREVSLLASLNGSLWWPRYGSQSSHCTACEGVFNMIISQTSPQVVDWIGVFAQFYFCALFAIHTFLSISPTTSFDIIFFSLFSISFSLPSSRMSLSHWVYLTQAFQPDKSLKWLCVNAGSQPKDQLLLSLLKCHRIPIFISSLSLSHIQFMSSVSIQSHTPLYKNVFNLNIRLPSPVLAIWTEDRIIPTFVAFLFPLRC